MRPIQAWQPLHLNTRGALRALRAIGVVAGLPAEIAKREMQRAASQLGPLDEVLRVLPANEGPGNILMVEFVSENVTEVFTGFGMKGVPSEEVGRDALRQAKDYLAAGVPVGPHLADQLLLPFALAGGGSFLTHSLTRHSTTNIEIISKFLPIGTEVVPEAGSRCRVTLRPRG